MGLFEFNKKAMDVPLNDWIGLNTLDQIKELIALSDEKPVAIFKHSTRCGISSHALHKLMEGWDVAPEALAFYYLDLLAFRHLSNAIAEELKVHHQSPQIILLNKRKVVHQATHGAISLTDLKNGLAKC